MTTRRQFLKEAAFGAAALAGAPALALPRRGPPRPNILFIMADDHGFQAMGCYGRGIGRTPQLDRLAAHGVRFDLGFCTNSICAPSRAALLSGAYSHRNGQVTNGAALDRTRPLFPRLLQQAGYATALVGKWHLNDAPLGFDYWNVLPGQGEYYNPDFIEMGTRVARSGYVTDLITDTALHWLERRDRGRPFCLMVHHKAPHRSWMPSLKNLDLYEHEEIPAPPTLFDDFASRSEAARTQEMSIDRDLFLAYDLKVAPGPAAEEETPREKSDRRMWQRVFGRLDPAQQARWNQSYAPRNAAFREAGLTGRELTLWKYRRYMQDYLRCVASVDENVGRLLDALEAAGLAEDTLVVYTSDQGFYLGEHGWFDKRFMYEESLRIPLLIRYPAAVAPGVNDSDMVLNIDFAPTFLDFAGAPIPAEMQGRSLRPLLAGARPPDWRRSIYYHYYEFPGAHRVKRHYGVRTHRYKLIRFYHDIDAWELYDLGKDPHELNNVFGRPEYAAVQAELEAELARLRAEVGDSDDDRFMPSPKIRVEHKAVGCAVALAGPCSPRYPGTGPNNLTDGLRGPDSMELLDTALWQGFEGGDLEAVIDLGAPTPIGRISAGFLESAKDWIFVPESVSYALSADGLAFEPVGTIACHLPPRQDSTARIDFPILLPNGPLARFVRVSAKNRGTCPEGHPGAGEPAWIFADEVEVG